MQKLELVDAIKRAEKNRMKVVDSLKKKQGTAQMYFNGEGIDDDFLEDYNKLVDEHNQIADVEQALINSYKEYRIVKGMGSPLNDIRVQEVTIDDQYINTVGSNLRKAKKVEDKKEFMNFDWKRLGKGILTGGLSEANTKVGKAVITGGLSTRVGKAVVSGGLSETKKGQVANNKINDIMDRSTADIAKVSGGTAVNAVKSLTGAHPGTMALAPMRGAFSALMKLNLWNMATTIGQWRTKNPIKYKAMQDRWYKIGGSRYVFDSNVIEGQDKKPVRFLYKKNMFNAEGNYLNYVGEAVVAYIGAASTVLTTMVAAFKKQGGVPDMPAGSEYEATLTPEEEAILNAAVQEVASGDVNPDANYTIWWVIGISAGLLAVGGLIWWLAKRKK